MGSAFFGLDTALRALRAAQQAIDVTSHNVANANTTGYSRQAVSLQATPPYTVTTFNRTLAAGQLGTGVAVSDVRRARSAFVDYQIRKENATLGRWELAQDTLDRIQVVFNEPSDAGLNQTLNQFWHAWQAVANNPEDKAIRASVVEQAQAVTSILKRNAEQLAVIQSDVLDQLRLNITDVNGLADQIAQLNLQVATSEADGNHANDLRDQRDALIERLAKITGVSTNEATTGEVGVFIGGRPLVDRTTVNQIVLREGNDGVVEPQWEDGTPVAVGSGRLMGLISLQNQVVPDYRAALDGLAVRLRDSVNSVHSRGYGTDGTTGNAFFVGSDAKTLAVADAIRADSAKVATAAVPSKPGDGSIALAIAQIEHAQVGLDADSSFRPEQSLAMAVGVRLLGMDVSKAAPGVTLNLSPGGPGQIMMSDGTTTQTLAVSDMTAASTQVLDFSSFGVILTLGDGGTATDTAGNIVAGLTGKIVTRAERSSINQDYETYIAKLGIEARSAKTMVDNQNVLVEHLDRQRDAISGVSLDDETVDLVRFQHAYQAAARLITVMDELLDKLINDTGTVGR